MTFKDGLLKARSHIIFLLGLIAAFGIVIVLETWQTTPQPIQALPELEKTVSLNLPGPAELSEDEIFWAQVAWNYFENNYQETTGLVNSVDGFPAATLWDTASYMMALITAERLEIIDRATFDTRLAKLLETLKDIELFENKLPNKSYNTTTALMVNYQNERSERGIGWSAIDIGRLLVPFNLIVWNYPDHTGAIRAILANWDFDALVRKGQIYGAAVDPDGKTIFLQEGRLGYEEYAAKSLSLLGKDVAAALRYTDYLNFVDVYGLQIPYDSRTPEEYEAHNYVVSEPYILDGVEFGWDSNSAEIAYRVYQAQEKRYEETDVLTAVSEDHLDQAPYFVYNTVFTSGKTWNCITEDGKDASEFKTLSNKAAVGWHMLYRTEYTKKLVDSIQDLYDPTKGWYSGRYENTSEPNASLTCNTNAIILEAIHYKKFGKFFTID